MGWSSEKIMSSTCYFNQYPGLAHLTIHIPPIVGDLYFFNTENSVFTENWSKWVKNDKKSQNHDKLSKKCPKSSMYSISEHTI